MNEADSDSREERPSRRAVVARAGGAAMAGGLILSYGTAAIYAGRFLYASRSPAKRWVFVCAVDDLAVGESLPFRTPAGERVTVTRSGAGSEAEDFVALSSICPHLGCQVQWQQQEERFFCPCHNGSFDPAGRATEGPPADAGTDLSRYPLQVRSGVLFLEAPQVESA